MTAPFPEPPLERTLTHMAANKIVRLVYKRHDGKWAWHLRVGANIIATDGSQGYENKADARDMADAIIAGDYAEAEKQQRDTPSDGAPPK